MKGSLEVKLSRAANILDDPEEALPKESTSEIDLSESENGLEEVLKLLLRKDLLYDPLIQLREDVNRPSI